MDTPHTPLAVESQTNVAAKNQWFEVQVFRNESRERMTHDEAETRSTNNCIPRDHVSLNVFTTEQNKNKTHFSKPFSSGTNFYFHHHPSDIQ
jgi:hypothetical protein